MKRNFIMAVIVFIFGSILGASISGYYVYSKYKFFLEVAFFEQTLNRQNAALMSLNALRENDIKKLIIFYEAEACSYYLYLPMLGGDMDSHNMTLLTNKYFNTYYTNENYCSDKIDQKIQNQK